jgi:hypothetical protein
MLFVFIYFFFFIVYFPISLITDLPLKTIASLNNYLIKNIITQEEEKQIPHALIQHSSSLNSLSEPTRIVIAKGNNLYAQESAELNHNHHSHDMRTTSPNSTTSLNRSITCKRCLAQDQSYIDRLKSELGRRIETEVTKGERSASSSQY